MIEETSTKQTQGNNDALRQVYRSVGSRNTLGIDRVKDVLENGVRTTGAGGRYPDGWITYTLPNGHAASWKLNGDFIGFRGIINNCSSNLLYRCLNLL